MIKATICVLSKPNTKPEYSLDFELPALPTEGDYITVRRVNPDNGEIRFSPMLKEREHEGAQKYPEVETFIVKRVRWELSFPDNGSGGQCNDVLVDVVPANSYWAHPNFKDGLPTDAPVFEWG